MAYLSLNNVNQIDEIINQSAMPDEGFVHWDAFLKIAPQQLKELPLSFIKLFGNSRFLCNYLLQNPQCLSVLDSSYLIKDKPQDIFRGELKAFKEGQPSPISYYKNYKYLELLRISLKDLAGDQQVAVLRELSYLAYAILEVVTEYEYKNLCQKKAPPIMSNGQEAAFHYLALGKMGGLELNYSSDIDLLAMTASADGLAGNLSLNEFFTKLTQNLTQTLQEKDATGFFYRVDWDLRPEGRSGPLVNSLSALETYYETTGADWQRQVFTKASLGSGDRDLGEQFIKSMIPFCYRKSFDLDSIRRIQDMKIKIHDSIHTTLAKGFNVKLGIGGIRDIEFFTQAFLMVFGGRVKAIRHVSTIEVISRLKQERFITNETEQTLLQSYFFLRRLENKLQMVDENQTHILPQEELERLKFARRMGYVGSDSAAVESFTRDLEIVRRNVKDIFDGLFAEKKTYHTLPNFSLMATNPYAEEKRPALISLLEKTTDFESKLDALRLFKNEQYFEIKKSDHGTQSNRQQILANLATTAELVVQEAFSMAMQELTPRFGIPTVEDHPEEAAHFVVLGMGKLGGAEINYLSDLDMIFIYSHNGETNGAKSITNGEYYARLVQKMISILTVATRHGAAYEVDTELRPSGHKGTLVISLESFLDYQTKVSAIWERQSLIRARPIAGSAHLAKIITEHISALLYAYPMPQGIRTEMNHLRTRVINELAREDENHFDYKLGKGGLMDIEYILQYLQLTEGSHHPLLRSQNTFEGLENLSHALPPGKQSLIKPLAEGYAYLRTFESVVTQFHGRKIHRLHVESPLLEKSAQEMSVDKNTLLASLRTYKTTIRSVYREVFRVKE